MNPLVLKVRQLLELAKSNNIHEATVATAAADRLIAKYRISEDDIAGTSNPEEDSEYLYSTARIIRWKSLLAFILAKNYGCALYNNAELGASAGGRRVSHYKLVGRKSDMELVRYLFGWMTGEIESLCKDNCKGLGHIGSQSYCEGAVTGIKLQLEKNTVEFSNEVVASGQSQALVKINSRLEEADRTMRSLHDLKKTKVYSSRKIMTSAYHKGIYDGTHINLSRENNPSRLLGN